MPGGGHAGSPPPFDSAAVRQLLVLASDALRRGDADTYGGVVEAVGGPGTPARHRLVVTTLTACLGDALRAGWSRGWQPADVARIVGVRAARYARDVIAEDARRFSPASMHPRWADQLRQLGTEVWWDQAEPHLGQWAVREGATASDALSDGLRLLSPAEVP